jgi:hypothetical protein
MAEAPQLMKNRSEVAYWHTIAAAFPVSAAQMLGELQRRHAGRYDLPSESDIGRRISKLSSDKKQAQDDDY